MVYFMFRNVIKHLLAAEFIVILLICVMITYNKAGNGSKEVVSVSEEQVTEELITMDYEKTTFKGQLFEQEQEQIEQTNEETQSPTDQEECKDFIKWVDFGITCAAMEDAYEFDVESQQSDIKLNWIELLSYLGARYGGNFKNYKNKDLQMLVNKLINQGMTMEDITKDMQYYSYYHEAYEAVLGGFVGEYEVENGRDENTGEITWEKKYGLKAYLPIAKNFPYNDYDDFGVSRTYGFKRQHLGHDMMGQVGTPIIAVESGYVEALGWNQYGGWRIGIRSLDGKRYYYYAHLRKNFPYVKTLQEGSIVQAGEVIGYLGRTGYSRTENTNNIDTPHLHFGMQIIFDESQKECNSEIWIDCYQIIKFLYKNRCETMKNEETKEWYRIRQTKDPLVEEYKLQHGIT